VAETDLCKWRHYESEIILLCVRWHLRYASYRDLEEMMNERGLAVDHTTIYRPRAAACAKRFFRKMLKLPQHSSPRVINVDQNRACPPAVEGLKEEVVLSVATQLRQGQTEGIGRSDICGQGRKDDVSASPVTP
jgi:transposase-like protein